MSRRALFVHTTQGERLTGGPRMLATLLEGLADGPLEPMLVTQREGDLTRRARDAGVAVEILPLPTSLDVFGGELARPSPGQGLRAIGGLFAYDRAFSRLLDRVQPAVAWTTNLRTLLAVAPACRRARIPMVWNIWLGQPSRGIVRAMNEAGIRLASRIITEYERQAGELFTPGQLARARPKLRTIHTGHSVAAPSPRRRRRPDEPVLIGTLGALSPRKDPRLFLEMAARVRRDVPSARIVTGGGAITPSLVTFTAELRGFAAARGLEDCVEWTGWTDDPLAFLARLDVYVQTSRAEGLPGAVREAMASARPVVATDVGGTREAVVDGETGFVTAAADGDALAAAVTLLAQDAELAAHLGSAGRRRFEECFSAEAFVRNTARVLEEAAGG